METTIDQLENLFAQAESDLNKLSTKVTRQYDALDKANTENTTVKPANAVHVANCITQLRGDLKKASEDIYKLKEEQKQMMADMKLELVALSNEIEVLKSTTGDAPFK